VKLRRKPVFSATNHKSSSMSIPMRPSTTPKGRNVKSVQATDAHERAKDFLSATEVAKLLDAMKQGRHGIRDHLLALMMFRHGLRVSEAIGIRRNEVDLDHSRLWVRRLKRGLDVEHPIAGDELRAIKRYSASRTVAPTRSSGSSSPNAGSRSRGKR
jgi:integrase